MSKDRATIGTDGQALPIMPPDRDPRVWARMVRVMLYTPGFLALLLLKAGDPAGFGITVSLLMLASGTAVIAGLFVGTQSSAGGADYSSKVGLWSGSLILELLAAVPFLCAVPPLFNQLAQSALLHGTAHSADPAQMMQLAQVGIPELLPAIAILPFMLYQLAGFGTLHYVVSKKANWVINLCVLALIVTSYILNRMNMFAEERAIVSLLMAGMAITVFYGVLKLRKMQTDYDLRCPKKEAKEDKEEKADK